MYDGHVDTKISSVVRAKKGVSCPFLTSGKKLANAHLRRSRHGYPFVGVQTLHARSICGLRRALSGRAPHTWLEDGDRPCLRPLRLALGERPLLKKFHLRRTCTRGSERASAKEKGDANGSRKSHQISQARGD